MQGYRAAELTTRQRIAFVRKRRACSQTAEGGVPIAGGLNEALQHDRKPPTRGIRQSSMAAIYMVLEETVGRLRAVYISAHHGEQLYRSAARRQRDPEVYSTALAPRPTPRQARSGFDAVMVCTTARMSGTCRERGGEEDGPSFFGTRDGRSCGRLCDLLSFEGLG